MRILSRAVRRALRSAACSTSIPRSCRPTAACTRIGACSPPASAMHGASVHFVTAELDGGPVVLQSTRRGASRETPRRRSPRACRRPSTSSIRGRSAGSRSGRLAWHDDAAWLDGAAARGARWWRISVRQSAVDCSGRRNGRRSARLRRVLPPRWQGWQRARRRAARRRCRRRRRAQALRGELRLDLARHDRRGARRSGSSKTALTPGPTARAASRAASAGCVPAPAHR